MPINILLLESITDASHAILSKVGQVLMADTPFDGLEIALKHPIHAIVTRGKGDVSQALISACPDLQIIARCGVGLDNIDVAFASEQGVKVVNAPGINADTVAEHALSLMLLLQRNLYQSIKAVKDGNWDFRKNYVGDEIRAKTLGIFGMGNIGQKVARLATAFGMKIIYWEIEKKEVPYDYLSFEEVLSQSDIISIHLPLVPSTKALIDEKVLQKMQSHTLLINTSRGEIVAQRALLNALQNGIIGGFAADVLAEEPPAKNDPLLALNNVLITPHSASLTARTYEQMCSITAQNTIDLLAGKAIDERYIFNRGKIEK